MFISEEYFKQTKNLVILYNYSGVVQGDEIRMHNNRLTHLFYYQTYLSIYFSCVTCQSVSHRPQNNESNTVHVLEPPDLQRLHRTTISRKKYVNRL